MGKIQSNLREIHQIGKSTTEYFIAPEHCPSLTRFQISLAGISLTTPQFRFVRHQPNEMQVLVGLRGCGRVSLRGAWRDCPAGAAYCTPRGQLHAYTGANGWEVGWICFEPSAPVFLPEPMLVEIDPRPLRHILYGMHLELSSHRDSVLLEHWAELLNAQVHQIIESRQQRKLWRLWQTVQSNLAFPWSLPKLAEAAGLGPEYLRRLCLQETGTTPMRHVIRLRMQQAIPLLRQGYKIDSVAKDVGYENAFAFSTAFKRTIGQSPSHFRAS